MRKTLCLILLVTVFMTSVLCAGAVEIDIGEMTINELIEFDHAIHDKLHSLIEDDRDMMYLSRYVVGKDVIPGRYLFTGCSESAFEYYVYKDMDSYEHADLILGATVYQGKTAYVTLEDGMVLVVISGQALIRQIDKPNWAP